MGLCVCGKPVVEGHCGSEDSVPYHHGLGLTREVSGTNKVSTSFPTVLHFDRRKGPVLFVDPGQKFLGDEVVMKRGSRVDSSGLRSSRPVPYQIMTEGN